MGTNQSRRRIATMAVRLLSKNMKPSWLTALSFAGFACLTGCHFVLIAQTMNTSSSPVFSDVTERGHLLNEYYTAASLATEAVLSTGSTPQKTDACIAIKVGSEWKVVFGHLSHDRGKFLISYEVLPNKDGRVSEPKKYQVPLEDDGIFRSAARAINLALRDFGETKRPYNSMVLPSSNHNLLVYVTPAQTNPDVYLFGGDVRYLISGDGESIIEKRKLHVSIIELKRSLDSPGSIASGYHTHVLSDVPEDTDIFYVLNRRPLVPELIRTNTRVFLVQIDGSIRRAR